jgi:GAF domain-containing protein
MDTVPGAITNPHRLVAVRRLLLLDTPPSPTFDRLTSLAAQLVEAPISLLTLVDSDRQFFLSAFGLPDPVRGQRETGIEFSICQHAVATRRPLIVADAHADPVLKWNAAVTELGITAYAGMPLITHDGHAVGTLCVLDVVVRDWTDDQLVALSHLADIAMDEIRLHLHDRAADRRREWHGVDSRWCRV